ncbi:MAG TPA: toll/interleukin-1 receptor domain-containing protein [Pseudonocardiaceae bacterium]|nr:toll/interleukin-1 receptor domain-containing protein [Pseudonocardiaceae bacterium]
MFINYRGEDSHSYGALLYTELTRQFGADRVFLDCESIPAGADFVEDILTRVRSAVVLLAVMGPRWLHATGATGKRRIDDPADWVRRELIAAFAAGVRVVPVLTEQATMPTEADLPNEIATLSRCQFRRLRYHDTTADLARLVTDLTAMDPGLAAAARSRADVPRQLPTPPAAFAGRATELARLTDTMAASSNSGAIVAIGGIGGIGKTALAVHWAYQHLHQFPDGQLYVDLRGFDPSGQPMPASSAIRGFLDALGVAPAMVPVELDAQAARYRSLVAGKRMLIVLDNVCDVDQVTPLLPGSPSCGVLVTSRRRLAGLATTHGARLLSLDVLPETGARALLARQLTSERLAAEPEAVADLLAACGGLPLALRIVIARAEHHAHFPLSVLAEELRSVSCRLDGLDGGDLRADLRAALSWSARALSTEAVSLFGLVGIAPGPDISRPAAASLGAHPAGPVGKLLRELENASLVQQHVPGRYRMHDLVRLYAIETAVQQQSEPARQAALRRVVDFLTHTAYTADRLLHPHRAPLPVSPPAPDGKSSSLRDASAALAWFEAEHAGLLAAQRTAASHKWDQTVWHLAWTLTTFLYWRGRGYEELAVWQAGLDAAMRLPDLAARVRAHRYLGRVCSRLGQHVQAIGHLEEAVGLAEQHGDSADQALTHQSLVWALTQCGDDRRALEHATHALRLFRTLDVPVWEAEALNDVGRCATRLGDFDQAREHCQASLVMHRQCHNSDGEAATLDSLGYIDHHTGRHHDAIHHYEQALALRRRLGNSYQIANILDALGNQHATLDQRGRAHLRWQDALELYRQQGRDADVARVQRQLDEL